MSATALHRDDAPVRSGLDPRAWCRVAAAIFVIGWGGNEFTPLLSVYRLQDGYSQIDVDVFLGAYVLGLIPGLLIASVISDRHGRRPVMLTGLIASMVGSLLLLAGSSMGYPSIFGGRLLSGIGVGIAMSVGTTWVTELSAKDPSVGPGAGARRATVWLTAGFAAGPAAAVTLAQWVHPALDWPYVVHFAVSVPVLVALVRARGSETHDAEARARSARRTEPSAARHPRFLHVVVPMAPWIFGSASIAYAVVPQVVSGALGEWTLLYSGAITVATLGTGLLVQPIARRLDHVSTARAVVASMVLMTAGVAMSALTAISGSPWLGLPVALLLGAAYGIAVVSGLLEVQRMADGDQVAALTGVYYALAYVGFLLPAVLAVLGRWFGYGQMLGVVAALCLLCTLISASGWSRHLPHSTPEPDLTRP